MFIDIEGFTGYSERVSPSELVGDIDRLFRGFDLIIEKYGIEKIKTIGDAYLCAAGLHSTKSDHAMRTLQAAKEIIEFVEAERQRGDFFKVRVGIHSGSLISGVVGKSKFAYDIWGDTVNVAARMEQNGKEGKINVSEQVYNLLKDEISFEHRGKLPVKNKGDIDMYFYEG
jgi:class 3 adenylate cyclase